jgi:hypothetical protein
MIFLSWSDWLNHRWLKNGWQKLRFQCLESCIHKSETVEGRGGLATGKIRLLCMCCQLSVQGEAQMLERPLLSCNAIRIKVVLNLHNRRPVERFKSGIRRCPKGAVWILFSIDNSRHKRVSVSS